MRFELLGNVVTNTHGLVHQGLARAFFVSQFCHGVDHGEYEPTASDRLY